MAARCPATYLPTSALHCTQNAHTDRFHGRATTEAPDRHFTGVNRLASGAHPLVTTEDANPCTDTPPTSSLRSSPAPRYKPAPSTGSLGATIGGRSSPDRAICSGRDCERDAPNVRVTRTMHRAFGDGLRSSGVRMGAWRSTDPWILISSPRTSARRSCSASISTGRSQQRAHRPRVGRSLDAPAARDGSDDRGHRQAPGMGRGPLVPRPAARRGDARTMGRARRRRPRPLDAARRR